LSICCPFRLFKSAYFCVELSKSPIVGALLFASPSYIGVLEFHPLFPILVIKSFWSLPLLVTKFFALALVEFFFYITLFCRRRSESGPCGDDEVYMGIQQGKIDEITARQIIQMNVTWCCKRRISLQVPHLSTIKRNEAESVTTHVVALVSNTKDFVLLFLYVRWTCWRGYTVLGFITGCH